uniref:RNA methyltransferase n=1 Tax=Cacopsylla melanoneura TaxID=428564 RepID=A0A8D8QSC4_9HEMI
MTNKADNFDPGAMMFGNFINYYQFHPPLERMKLLKSAIWQQMQLGDDEHIVCLDVGCNCGDLTESLYENLQSAFTQISPTTSSSKQIQFLGIDIDSTLITRAIEKNNYENNIRFKSLDVMEHSAMEYLDSYLRDECQVKAKESELLDEKSLNIDHNKMKNIAEPIENTQSNTTDVKHPNGPQPRTSKKFDIVFCFSVTMWIHLNHGDQGLLDFLEKISSLGKYLVLENQLWKCYRNAQRRIVKNATKDKVICGEKEKGSNEKSLGIVCDSIECDNNGEDRTNSNRIESETNKKNIESKDNNRNRRENKDKQRKKSSEEVGFKYYHKLKIRSNVTQDIDSYLIDKCNARKLYESEANEWGRVITVYKII